MNSFALFLLAIVAASAAANSLRKDIKKAVKKVDTATELKRFEEEMRAKKFDEKVGKVLFKHQEAKKIASFFPRSGTTYNAEGKPLITKRVVGSAATEYMTAFIAQDGATSCSDADMYYQTSGSLDTCETIYSYDHSTQASTTTSSKSTRSSGDAPWTITMQDYSDDSCATAAGSPTTIVVSDTCEEDGVDYFSGYYGYGAISSSLVTSPPSADGIMTLGYGTDKCSSALGSDWESVTMILGSSDQTFGDCISDSGYSAKYSCSGGDLTYTAYQDDKCESLYDDDVAAALTQNVPLITKGDCIQSTQDDDATSGSDDYGSDSLYTSGYCTTTASSESATCFAGSEMVTLESGVSKPIADVVVGDRVLAANAQGALSFSDVIAVPHAKNNDRVMFNEISLANGVDIRMTGEHLLPVAASCGADAVFTVTAAKDVAVESCVMTVDGQSSVVSNNKVAGTGIYTIVTNEEYVVVNGVVASPFAASHAMGNTFYNVYRAMYNYVPGLFKSSVFQTFHSTFATVAMKTW